MSRVMITILVCFNLIIVTCAQAQHPFGLRGASFLRGILFGTAVRSAYLRIDIDAGQYADVIGYNYGLLVPEGELKSLTIWQGENQYQWDGADFLLGAPNETGWVQQNSMQLRGHNLVWAQDPFTPDWLLKNESSITPDKAKQLLSDYIHTVVGRYRGKIPWWDVVNEAVDESNNTNPFNLRDCIWLRKLGPDFMKYAFQFAHEADPDVKLYYNDFGLEAIGPKVTRTLNLVKWLRSEGVTVDGIGLQWHTRVGLNVTPGDVHYQSAQQFIDNQLDIMVTELDISVPTVGAYPINTQDLQTQGDRYAAMLNYALYFAPHCKAMLTWGFTDRYSWIPTMRQFKQGAPLPFDWLYLPKPAYWQMLDIMTHVTSDGIYRISLQSQPDKCLGISQNGTSNQVQLYNDSCNNAYEKWNITWQGDGTYRFSSSIDNNRVLAAYNTTATVGDVEMVTWSNNFNQEWAFSSQGNNTYRIAPRMTWWHAITVYNTSNDIVIADPRNVPLHDWILIEV